MNQQTNRTDSATKVHHLTQSAKKNMQKIQKALSVTAFHFGVHGLSIDYSYNGNDYHLMACPERTAELLLEAGCLLHITYIELEMMVTFEVTEYQLVSSRRGMRVEEVLLGDNTLSWDAYTQDRYIDEALAQELACLHEFQKHTLLY